MSAPLQQNPGQCRLAAVAFLVATVSIVENTRAPAAGPPLARWRMANDLVEIAQPRIPCRQNPRAMPTRGSGPRAQRLASSSQNAWRMRSPVAGHHACPPAHQPDTSRQRIASKVNLKRFT